jgi:hypothetical protein
MKYTHTPAAILWEFVHPVFEIFAGLSKSPLLP